jgi:hypothetical protein
VEHKQQKSRIAMTYWNVVNLGWIGDVSTGCNAYSLLLGHCLDSLFWLRPLFREEQGHGLIPSTYYYDDYSYCTKYNRRFSVAQRQMGTQSE